MEDVIYIIIGLLWLIFTFYVQSKRKKQREAQAARPGPSSSKAPRSFFDQLFTEEHIPQAEIQDYDPESEVSSPVIPEKKKRPSSFVEEYERMGIKSLEDTILKNYQMEFTETVDYDLGNELDLKSAIRAGTEPKERLEFDLKKAVIMAEILKRPYS